METRQLVEKYATGGAVPGQWIKGLTPEDLMAVPVPGKWSVQQLIQHVLDSDLIASHRMKRIIAEENPLLISYDETCFAQKLGYEKLDPQLACDLFRLNRELTAQILRQQTESAFERSGIHNEHGKMSLRECVEMYVDHLDHHEPFLAEKRKRLGKPL